MELIIISGRSGSGKSTALHQLEDEGYYCIDNLPVSLLPHLMEEVSRPEFGHFRGAAVCIDARNAWKDLARCGEILDSLPATVHISGADIFAAAESEDMYAAIDALADKLDRQLIKHKEKSRGH